MAAGLTISNGFGGLFGDQVFTSTDLNRRCGEVLNRAREHPITISRNNEQFALLRREDVARLFRALSRISLAVELMSEARTVMAGNPPSKSFSWLGVYEKDDLEKLCTEILEAASKATAGLVDDPGEVEAIVHEWRESALLVRSGTLDAAMFTEEADETPLPDPTSLLQSAGEAESDPACLNQ
jgi:prevent-host-death family protein